MPAVCVIRQVAALLPERWHYQGGETGGWLSITLPGNAADIGSLHRRAFEIQEASDWVQLLKRNNDAERAGRDSMKASNEVVRESLKRFHICG